MTPAAPNSAAPRVGAIILAAGASSRLGQPKQLLPFEGQSLLCRVIEAALASRCAPVVVVLGAGAEALREEIGDAPVIVALNADWEQGLSTSIRAGIAALGEADTPDSITAAIIAPCDQPHLSRTVLERLIDVHHATLRPIAVSGYEGIWGTPMLFARALWPELEALQGDRGAKAVALRHAEGVECVPFAAGALDIDTPGDYARLRHTASEADR